jgi:gliding motility-associatede transport system auxiliary component
MVNRIFSFIGWVGTALVLAAVGIRYFLPARDQYATYLAWAGLACMALYIASQWREILGYFKTRQARYGTLAAFSIFIALGILVAVNYIGKRENKRWDLTASKQFSLSDQSRNFVSKLDAPLNVHVFDKDINFQGYRDRLKEYEYASKQVKAEYTDPDRNPAAAQQYKVEQYGTLVLEYKGRSERITQDTEQDITNAIIKVVSGQQKKVYFTDGHGEHDTASSERDGYNTIVQALGRENYTTDKLVLAQKNAVPDDATVVVIAGPKTDFFPPEIEALKAFLGKNGKVLMLLDPPARADSPPLTNLIALAHDWGIDVGNDVVVDVSGMGQLFGATEAVPVVVNYPSHPITDRFRVMTAYPLARSAAPVEGGVNGHTAVPLAQTTDRAWAESDVQGLLTAKKVALDPGKDKPGPITLAAAVTGAAPLDPAKPPDPNQAQKPETRLVVFGDSDFASNSVLGIEGNRDIFMNAVGWLSQQENLISVRAKEPDDRRLTLTARAQNGLTILSVFLVPGLVFLTGVYSWWRRR